MKDWEGKPKGTCFCDYKDQEGVKKALEFNETEYGGRTIYVRVAEQEGGKSKGKKGDKGGKGKGKDGGFKGKGKKGDVMQPGEKPEGCKSVIVKNMSYEATEDSIREFFSKCGEIERVKLLMDQEKGTSRGAAFVDFSETSNVDEAVKLCNTEMGGRYVFVDFAGGKGAGGKGDGKKGDGKKGGKKGDGKKGGKKGKGKGENMARSANTGGIVESTGTTKSFDSDSD